MRFIITSGPDPAQPSVAADGSFDHELFAKYMKFNEDLHEAGVLVASEGINPGQKSARVGVVGGKRKVLDGPFTEAKEVIAGFWILQTKTKEEVIEWVKRCPNPTGEDSEIEIRQIFEADDFGAEFTPELREQEERIAQQAAANANR